MDPKTKVNRSPWYIPPRGDLDDARADWRDYLSERQTDEPEEDPADEPDYLPDSMFFSA